MSSITSQPQSNLLRASDKLCFTLEQSDIGDTNVTKKGVYQLKCVDTDKWLMKNPSMFRGPKPVTVDLMDLVTCRLRTTVPQINQQGMNADLTGKKKVQLHYGESIHDSQDCENNSCDLTETSDEYTIVNSNCPQYQLDLLGEGQILAEMPKHIIVCEGTNDWIWVCGSAQINLEIITSDGAKAFSSYSPTSGLNYISTGPGNVELGNSGPVTGVIDRDKISCIKIYKDGVLVSSVSVKKCGCNGCTDRLYFLDPKGSIRGVGMFESNEDDSIDTTGQEICRQASCNTSIQDAYAYYGTRYMAKKAWERITLTAKMCVDCDNKNFYRAFVSASAFWIERRGMMLGFIADSRPSSFKKDNDLTEFTISGYISTQFPRQSIN